MSIPNTAEARYFPMNRMKCGVRSLLGNMMKGRKRVVITAIIIIPIVIIFSIGVMEWLFGN